MADVASFLERWLPVRGDIGVASEPAADALVEVLPGAAWPTTREAGNHTAGAVGETASGPQRPGANADPRPGRRVRVADLRSAGLAGGAPPPTPSYGGWLDGALLLTGELGSLGEHAEEAVAAWLDAVRPGGVVAVTAPGKVLADLTAESGERRSFDAAELRWLFEQRGAAVECVAAPGVGAWLAGHAKPGGSSPAGASDPETRTRVSGVGPAAAIDPETDTRAGILDAGPWLLAVARTPSDEDSRSEHFFAGLPRKVCAAATVCRDGDGSVLVVYDTFKESWTLPGGVVDAEEDPAVAAGRETWEEAGVEVAVGRVLGVFSQTAPDRLTVVYDATPTRPQTPGPRHLHETSEAAFVPTSGAMEQLSASSAYRLRRCLDSPGGSWHQPS